ncbi:MAG TPA: hypothetical protein VKT29_03175 [Terriglobales bacterium]|nr:hypothetical protein [Terriglobales bacterium]
MIITRTPFRITLGGGGTDLPGFYGEHGGFILAMGIDKYMYLNLNTPILDDRIRVSYSQTELVDSVDQVEHTLVREALRFFHIASGVEIVSVADIPAGTGLGSSSCYLVGLLNGLHILTQTPAGPRQLAEEACNIELQVLRKPIGKQDQYMAAFGGLVAIEIDRHGHVSVSPLAVSAEVLEALESNLLLFYTFATRDATAILAQQENACRNHQAAVTNSLREIKDIGLEIRDAIVQGNLRRFGELMDAHWQSKKRLAGAVSNAQIDAWYEIAKRNGALGGKISGAGGGGFLTLYCEGDKARLRQAMRHAGLRELSFRLELEGSKVIFNVLSRDARLAHMERQSRSCAQMRPRPMPGLPAARPALPAA